MKGRGTLRLIVVLALLLVTVLTIGVGAAAEASPGEGFRALSDSAAAEFSLPDDVVLVNRFDLPRYGLTYERYQQVFGNAAAEVLGGQLTLLKEGNTTKYVIGAHYPTIAPSNAVNLTAVQARQRAASDVGAAGERITTLMINPASGRFFFQVETRRADARWFHWIDAGNGALLKRFNALMHDCDGISGPCGFGVQYSDDPTDIKDLSGLTTLSGGEYLLRARDGRQETHDQGSSRRPFLGPVASDADDSWVLLGDESPAQQALVDAHYYANVTDEYYAATHSYDWVAGAIAAGANDKMEVHAHYSKDYNNAFWNGTYIALGDGDQVSFEELTALDVIGHELSHGVTDFTSDLIYQDESGALNEAFSDIMGASMEFWAEAAGLEPATSLEPDWFIGEDFDLTNDTVPGFRNMADPGEDGDPSHYDERYTGSDDNGGVHTNSGIGNHWYYLLVEGGRNSDPYYASDTSEPEVTGIGLAAAEPIAFLGFTTLPPDATFCDARASTIAVAGTHGAEVADAWDEVGVDEVLCGGGTTDYPPSVTLTSPNDGDTVSGTVTVTADASDDNGVSQVEFLVDGSSIGTDSDGSDGWSASWDTTAYADGAHNVEAVAIDTADQTASDTVGVTVDNVNDSPVATFTFSCSGLTCDFDASGSYDPDGSIASYGWDFGDENSASGVTTSHTYAADGTYTVVLTVTDDEGATGADSQDVTVSSSSGPATMYVFDIAMSSKTAGPNRSGIATVTIKDTQGNSVDGATVYGTWSGDYNGSTSGTTGTDGTVRFESGKVRQANASFTFTVDNVEKTGYSYDSLLNVETSDEITVP